jgi:hypothetical protein
MVKIGDKDGDGRMICTLEEDNARWRTEIEKNVSLVTVQTPGKEGLGVTDSSPFIK